MTRTKDMAVELNKSEAAISRIRSSLLKKFGEIKILSVMLELMSKGFVYTVDIKSGKRNSPVIPDDGNLLPGYKK